MRSQLLVLALAFSGLTGCNGSPAAADDAPISTDAAEQLASAAPHAEERTCLLPVDRPVTRRTPLWMVGATTIERVDVFWWHGVPQPSDSDPTTSFTIDRHDGDADTDRYEGHELGTEAPVRTVEIDISRRPATVTAPIGLVKLSTPGQPDEQFELGSSAPCADL